MRRLRCEDEEDEGRHEDGSRIDPRGDVVVNGVEGAEDEVASNDPVFEFDFERGRGLERGFRRMGARPEPTRISRYSRPAPALSRTGSAYWASARASINRRVPVAWAGGIGSTHLLFLADQRRGTHHGDGPRRRGRVRPPPAGRTHPRGGGERAE